MSGWMDWGEDEWGGAGTYDGVELHVARVVHALGVPASERGCGCQLLVVCAIVAARCLTCSS